MSTIKVEGMSCGHCSGAVKDALEKANAGTVEVDLKAGLVTWTGDIAATEVKRLIDAQGFVAILP